MKTIKFLHLLLLFGIMCLVASGSSLQAQKPKSMHQSEFSHENFAVIPAKLDSENGIVNINHLKLERLDILYFDVNDNPLYSSQFDAAVKTLKTVTSWRSFETEFDNGNWNFIIINIEKADMPSAKILNQLNDFVLNGNGRLILNLSDFSLISGHPLLKTLGINGDTQLVNFENRQMTIDALENSLIPGSKVLHQKQNEIPNSTTILNPTSTAIINVVSKNARAQLSQNDAETMLNDQVNQLSGLLWADNCENATYIWNLHYWYGGDFEHPDQEAWFYFYLDKPTTNVYVSLCDSEFDTQLTVYDGCDGNELGWNDDYPCYTPDDVTSLLYFPELESGFYYVRIKSSNGDYGNYSLRVQGDWPIVAIVPESLSVVGYPGEYTVETIYLANYGWIDMDATLEIEYTTGMVETMAVSKDNGPISAQIKRSAKETRKSFGEFKALLGDDSIIFEDDMENGINGWSFINYRPDQLWHQTSTDYYSYNKSWWSADESTGNYNTGNTIEMAIVSPVIDLSDEDGSVYLYFYEFFDTEEGWDYCIVGVSTDGGTNWDHIRGGNGFNSSGYNGGWKLTYLNLSAYAGQQINIKFLLDTGDELNNEHTGWLIDDVVVSNRNPFENWLYLENDFYVIPPGWMYFIDVHFDATGLLPGNYSADIVINTFDPSTPVTRLPVSFTVLNDFVDECDEAIEYLIGINPYISDFISVGGDEWFRFEIYEPVAGLVVDACGSDFDSQLEIYTDCAALPIAENDDNWCDVIFETTSKIKFENLEAGTYFVRLTNKSDYEGYYFLAIYEEPIMRPPTDLSATLDEDTGVVTLDWEYWSLEGFYEDFEDGVADNFVFSDSRFSVLPLDGFLKMEGEYANNWAGAYYNAIYKDFLLSFTYQYAESPASLSFPIGAFFRSDGFMSFDDPANGYLVAVNGQGFYSAWKVLDGLQQNIIPWTFSPLLNLGLFVDNVISVQAVGDYFEIYINYLLQDTFYDDTFIAGYYGICAFDPISAKTTIWYDLAYLVPLTGMMTQHEIPHAIESLNNKNLSNRAYFTGFDIFRNNQFVATTSGNSFSDYLQQSGNYEYLVVAAYSNSKYSYPAGPVYVSWNTDPEIDVYPASLEVNLQPDEISYEYITVANAGGSKLSFFTTITEPGQQAMLPNPTAFASQTEKPESLNSFDGIFEKISSIEKFNTAKSSQVSILLFRDKLAWGYDVSVPWLETFGVNYTVAASASMATIDLSAYDVIIFESDQVMSFYQTYIDNLGRFEDFVSDGGFMFFNSATSHQERIPFLPFPGGISTMGAPDYSFSNYVNTGSPVVAGLDMVYLGNAVSHESFINNWGSTVNVVNEFNRPTLVEYNYGNGTILISGMTLEYGNYWNDNYANLYPNAIQYFIERLRNFWLKVSPYSTDIQSLNQLVLYLKFESHGLLAGSYNAELNIFSNDPENPWVTIPITLNVSGIQQVVTLPQGWSGISSWVVPTNANVETIFEPVLQNLVILQGESGFFWPGQNTNTIGSWNVYDGYAVKMNMAANVSFNGYPVINKTVALNQGWNLVPVLSECPVQPQLLDNQNIVMIKEVAGWRVYWPALGINTLEYLETGLSYYFYLNSSHEITFPSCADQKSVNNSEFSILPETSGFSNQIVATASTHTIAIPEDIAGFFNQGDIIEVYDVNGNFRGMGISNGKGFAITAFGNDETTQEYDGFMEGDQMRFKLVKAGSKSEFNLTLTFDESYPSRQALFALNGLSVVRQIEAEAVGVNNLSTSFSFLITPNPANEQFALKLFNSEMQSTELQIINMEGQMVMSQSIDSQSTRINISYLKQGIYIVKVITNGVSASQRLIKY